MPSNVGDNAIGIDPGLHGAIVRVQLMSTGGFHIHEAYPLPFNDEGELQVKTFLGLMRTMTGIPVVLEQSVATAMTFSGERTGTTAIWRIGLNHGRLTASLDLGGIEFSTVHPRTWTAKLHKGQSKEITSKERSLAVFTRNCTAHSQFRSIPPRCRKHHDGIIDAALIAWWALQTRTQ